MLNWNNLIQRTLSGLLFLIVTIGMLYIGSITYFLFISIVMSLALYEFYLMARKYQIHIPYFYVLLISLAIFSLYFFISLKIIAPIWLSIIIIPLIFFLFVGELYRFHKKPMHNIAFSLLSIIYITIPLTLTNNFVFIEREDLLSGNFLDIRSYEGFFSDVLFFNPERNIIYSPFIFLGFLSIIWIYDTFAYLFGVSFGKHRLFERISPKKSWEGLIGGTLVTLAASVIFPLIFHILTWQNWFVLSIIVIFSATMGDLVESLFKRSLDLKDSGNLIPGHGGILDRFDSVFLAVPAAFIYLQMLMQ
ncbi:MAG: phosphatidate cytidylyltransferase [Bacteroidales bacterium]|nr:phosphatidate cytidylyltransferase [Bacteroidales bacterium]